MNFKDEIFKFLNIFTCFLLFKILFRLIRLNLDHVISVYFSDPIAIVT